MQTEPSKADPPKRQRRWSQFSLRTLMIGVTLCAAWLDERPLNFAGCPEAGRYDFQSPRAVLLRQR